MFCGDTKKQINMIRIFFKRKFLTYFLIIFLLGFSNYQKSTLEFSLEMPNKKVLSHKDLKINLVFKNVGNVNIVFPQYLEYGSIKGIGYKNYDAFFYLEKIKKDKTELQKSFRLLKDYLLPQTYDTILPKKNLERNFGLDRLFEFTKGKYRVRVKFVVPDICNAKQKIIFSNWVIFEVLDSKIKYP